MAINTLEYAKLFQTNLDKQVTQQATTGWMEANAGQVKYSGGDEIKIPEIAVQGLGTYNRDDGFVQGSVTYKYQTHKLTQDRGRTFQLDAIDVDETNFGASAANVMSEFQRLHVIPEIDAYRYSVIAAKAIKASNSEAYTLGEATIVKKLYAHIFALGDQGVDMSQLIIPMSYKAYETLTNNATIQKKIDAMQFSQGGLHLTVKSIEGIPLIPVSTNRMKTKFIFRDGKTAGQEAGGFAADTTAKEIHWFVMAKTAPIAISKTDVVRIFDPATHQKANAWKIDYRKYHDAIIPNHKLAMIYAAVGA